MFKWFWTIFSLGARFLCEKRLLGQWVNTAIVSRGGSSTTFKWPLARQLGFLNIYVCTLFIQRHMWYVISKLKTKQGVEYNQQYPHFMTLTTTETTN